MRLHIDNILLGIDAHPNELSVLKQALQQKIQQKQPISLRLALHLLQQHRESLA